MATRLDLAKARHELRGPINHILGYCEILLEEEAMPEEIVEDLTRIRTGGKQLLELLLSVDCVMPGLDGLELLQRIRMRNSPSELPIIMVTGRDASHEVARALKLGANDYLTKPVDFEGEVVVGNIGSEKRAKYGAVGTQVNLAGRIQSLTVGGEVLVSEATALALGARLKTNRTLTISAKGTATPLKLHSVIGLRGLDHLELPDADAPGAAPLVYIPVRCFRLLETKMLADSGFEGTLAVVSSRAGLLSTAQVLHSRSDLKLVLASESSPTDQNVYCKVMDEHPGPAGASVRFTSALPRPWRSVKEE